MAQLNIKQIRGLTAGSILFLDSDSKVTEDFSKLNWNFTDQKLNINGSIQLNTSFTSSTPVSEGELRWNQDDLTLDIGLDGGSVLQTGQEVLYRVKNSGQDIQNGDAVAFEGSGNSGILGGQLAIADGTMSSRFMMGIATQDIGSGSDGYVTHFGKVRGIDTTGGAENWQEGQELWLSPTQSGRLTNVKPQAPYNKISVAAVLVAHSNGTLFVRPHYVGNLDEADDVQYQRSKQNLDVLSWNSTTERFELSQLVGPTGPAGVDGASGTSGTSGTSVTATAFQKILYVDKKGNDNTALEGRIDKPWSSIYGAFNYLRSNSKTDYTVYVMPGSYEETSLVVNSANNNLTLILKSGASITCAESNLFIIYSARLLIVGDDRSFPVHGTSLEAILPGNYIKSTQEHHLISVSGNSYLGLSNLSLYSIYDNIYYDGGGVSTFNLQIFNCHLEVQPDYAEYSNIEIINASSDVSVRESFLYSATTQIYLNVGNNRMGLFNNKFISTIPSGGTGHILSNLESHQAWSNNIFFSLEPNMEYYMWYDINSTGLLDVIGHSVGNCNTISGAQTTTTAGQLEGNVTSILSPLTYRR